jgi:hypothetical protein
MTESCMGAVVAFVLNMIVPHEESKPEVRAESMIDSVIFVTNKCTRRPITAVYCGVCAQHDDAT